MTPNEIEHNGKTLQRLPRIEDTREGDWVMISENLLLIKKLHTVLYVTLPNEETLRVDKIGDIIQAAYREKKEEAYPWINSSELISITDEWANNYLTAEYGSPEALMRKGAESAIQLDDYEWYCIEKATQTPTDQWAADCTMSMVTLASQALANCRPKGGAK